MNRPIDLIQTAWVQKFENELTNEINSRSMSRVAQNASEFKYEPKPKYARKEPAETT